MKTLFTKEIEVSIVKVSDRLRQIDDAWVDVLAQSISENGLQQPIQVMEIDGAPVLIAGAHRLAAVKRLQLVKILAHVVAAETDNPQLEARLLEIDENLFRRELRGLDRMRSLAERKELYLQVYPDKKQGTAGAKAKHGSASAIFAFAESTAEKIGLGKRTVFSDIATFKALSTDSTERLTGSKYAETATDIRLIAALKHEDQAKVLDFVLPAGGWDLLPAINYVTGKKTESNTDKFYRSAVGSLNRLTPTRRDDVFEVYQDEIIAFVKKRGLV